MNGEISRQMRAKQLVLGSDGGSSHGSPDCEKELTLYLRPRVLYGPDHICAGLARRSHEPAARSRMREDEPRHTSPESRRQQALSCATQRDLRKEVDDRPFVRERECFTVDDQLESPPPPRPDSDGVITRAYLPPIPLPAGAPPVNVHEGIERGLLISVDQVVHAGRLTGENCRGISRSTAEPRMRVHSDVTPKLAPNTSTNKYEEQHVHMRRPVPVDGPGSSRISCIASATDT